MHPRVTLTKSFRDARTSVLVRIVVLECGHRLRGSATRVEVRTRLYAVYSQMGYIGTGLVYTLTHSIDGAT